MTYYQKECIRLKAEINRATIMGSNMNQDLDQVNCARCGFNSYKDDCARTTDGGYLCESCQDKYDSQDEKGGEDGGE